MDRSAFLRALAGAGFYAFVRPLRALGAKPPQPPGRNRPRSVVVYPPPMVAYASMPINITIRGSAAIFPSSYYDGPLGTNNILPASSDGALIILWGGYSGQTYEQWQTFITGRYNALVASARGRGMDGVGFHDDPTNSTYVSHWTWAHDNFDSAFIANSWTPGRLTKGSTNLNTMDEINQGMHDQKYSDAADAIIALPYKVMLRMFWEHDGDWYPWSPRSNAQANDGYPNPGCTAAEWISAWRRIIGIFQNRAAVAGKPLNVGFWWCPTEGNSRTWATNTYPGNAYVDWVGSDCYCRGGASGNASPLHVGWAEFWELFNYTRHGFPSGTCKHDEFGPSKPYVVGETSTLYEAGYPDKKRDWFKNIDDHAYGKADMPYLCGVEFFDQDLAYYLNRTEAWDWRVDHNQSYADALGPDGLADSAHLADTIDGSFDQNTYDGFLALASRARWNVGVLGGSP